MTIQTPHLHMALLAAEQAQKHVTLNEALVTLDALLHLAVKSRSVSAPPVDPLEGDRYIIAAAPSGLWADKQNRIALYSGSVWTFISPQAGFSAWIEDEAAMLNYNGSAWVDGGAGILNLHNLERLGVGTSADATNPFSAKLNAALWNAKTTAEGGNGDLRAVMNKQAAAHTVSMLMQANYTGHAELGLTGNNHFSMKVSPDGSAWHTAIGVNNATAAVGIGGEAVTADAMQIFGNGAVNVTHATAPQIKFTRSTGNVTGRISMEYSTGLNQVLSNPGGAVSAFYEFEPAAGSGATISYFRYTNIPSGNCYFNVSKGDNTGSTAARLSGGALNSYVNIQGGNFGVGSSSPTEKLTVAGNIAPSTDNAYSLGVSGRRWSEVWAATGVIQTSDERLKTAVNDTSLGLAFINQLRPVSYKWIAAENHIERIDVEDGMEEYDTGELDAEGNPVIAQRPTFGKEDRIIGSRAGERTHYGLIAQEVKAVITACGAMDFAGYIEADPDDAQSERGLRYDQFIAPLIKAVQELSAQLNTQADRLQALES